MTIPESIEGLGFWVMLGLVGSSAVKAAGQIVCAWLDNRNWIPVKPCQRRGPKDS